MKNIIKWTLTIVVGLFFIACGGSDEQVQGFSKSGNAGPLKVTYSSDKPLTVGDNTIVVEIKKDGKPVTGAKVEFKVFMPEMPGMPYMEDVRTLSTTGNSYSGNINFSMAGTWQVKIYIEKDGKKYKYSSSVIL